MNKFSWNESLSLADEKYVLEADPTLCVKKRSSTRTIVLRYVILAAAVMLMIGASIVLFAALQGDDALPYLSDGNTTAEEATAENVQPSISAEESEMALKNFNTFLESGRQSGLQTHADLISKYAGAEIGEDGRLIVYVYGELADTKEILAELEKMGTPSDIIWFRQCEKMNEE